MIRDLIRDVLNSDTVSRINFGVPDWYFPEPGAARTTHASRRREHGTVFRVYPHGYRTLARAFNNGPSSARSTSSINIGLSDYRPAAPTEPNPVRLNPGMMMYMPHLNTLFMHTSFGDSNLTELSFEQRALIVHECTHALNDYNRISGAHRYIDETMAYVAQYLYRFHESGGNPPYFPHNPNAQYHSIANAIAMRFSVERGYPLVEYQDLLDMKNALLSSVSPDGTHDYADVNNPMSYDGFP